MDISVRDRNRATKARLKLTAQQISEGCGVPPSTVVRYFGRAVCGFSDETESPITEYLASAEATPRAGHLRSTDRNQGSGDRLSFDP